MDYRSIYTQNFGTIPVGYDIHHIDGNHANNDPKNLKAVSLQEHYDIHYAQGDWGACNMIANRINLGPEIRSELARKTQLKRVENGSHHFLGGEMQKRTQKKLVKEGKHHLLGGKITGDNSRKRVKEGTHNFLNGKYNYLYSSDRQKKRIAEGRHPFNNINEVIYTCPHCNKTGKSPSMKDGILIIVNLS